MSSESASPHAPPRRLRRPGRAGRVLVAVALASVLILAGLGTYEYVTSEFGGTTLVVYTYPSLFEDGSCGECVLSAVFGQFASAHHIRIELEYPRVLYSTLVDEAAAPAADLVIGLDEITTPQAAAAHLLFPYAPPGLADVSPGVVEALSATHAAVPYQYGYLAVDYNRTFYAATHGAVASLTLPEVVANRSWARNLTVEDPVLDITGEEFLLWQIEYYEQVLHENWTTFWTSAPSGTPPLSDSYNDAWNAFESGSPSMVVSYSTDPAYAAYWGEGGWFNSTGSWWNGTQYTWETVYGIGIVNGSRHLSLDEEFENWFLSGPVQAEIPTNEWEYPANSTVPLPSIFSEAIPRPRSCRSTR